MGFHGRGDARTQGDASAVFKEDMSGAGRGKSRWLLYGM